MKMQDRKMTDKMSGVENAELENNGLNFRDRKMKDNL